MKFAKIEFKTSNILPFMIFCEIVVDVVVLFYFY